MDPQSSLDSIHNRLARFLHVPFHSLSPEVVSISFSFNYEQPVLPQGEWPHCPPRRSVLRINRFLVVLRLGFSEEWYDCPYAFLVHSPPPQGFGFSQKFQTKVPNAQHTYAGPKLGLKLSTGAYGGVRE